MTFKEFLKTQLLLIDFAKMQLTLFGWTIAFKLIDIWCWLENKIKKKPV